MPINKKELTARFGKIMFNYYADENVGFNNCAIQGNCSIDPILYSLMEVLLYELKQVTYYMVKLMELGYENKPLRKKIIQYLSLIIIGYEFNRNEFEKLLREIDNTKKEVEKYFIKICEEKNLDCQILHSSIKFDNFDFSNMVNQGERQAILKNKSMSQETKNLTEIILQLLKSASVRLLELEEYGVECGSESNAILKFFNTRYINLVFIN